MSKSDFTKGYAAPHAVIVKIAVKQILCNSLYPGEEELPEEGEGM